MDDLEPVVGLSVGEREPTHWKAWLRASQPVLQGPQAPNTLTGSQWDHMFMNGPGSPATIASLAIRWRSSVLLVKLRLAHRHAFLGLDPSGSSALAWEFPTGTRENASIWAVLCGVLIEGRPGSVPLPGALTAAGDQQAARWIRPAAESGSACGCGGRG